MNVHIFFEPCLEAYFIKKERSEKTKYRLHTSTSQPPGHGARSPGTRWELTGSESERLKTDY
jgi:hypothetical protein